MKARLAAVALFATACAGCSHTLSGQLSRTVQDFGNEEGDVFWPSEREANGGPLVGGRFHHPRWQPFVLGAEMGLLNEQEYSCCQYRVNGMAGVSWLPLERKQVGFEAFAVGTFTNLPVNNEKLVALGLGPRIGLPFRLFTLGYPCADDPVAAATFILGPEAGISFYLPIEDGDRSVQTEGMILLTLAVHVSADDVFRE